MEKYTQTLVLNLTVSVEVGEYGSFIKIKRDRKWMCLSASLSKIIYKNLQKLRNNGYVLHLTKAKRLEVITFKDKRYANFVQISHYQEKEYKYFINFNDDEWGNSLGENGKHQIEKAQTEWSEDIMIAIADFHFEVV